MTFQTLASGFLWALLTSALACGGLHDLARYRLSGSGSDWTVAGDDHVLDDLQPRYPDFFARVFDEDIHELDLQRLRDDLEHQPVDRRNFDALNALAIAYFEVNARAESNPDGLGYLSNSFQSAKLAGVPWSAYGRVDDARLRDAILDFFEDIASGGKLRSDATAARLIRTVASLKRKEENEQRLQRIQTIVEALESRAPAR